MNKIVHCRKEPYDVLIDRTTKWRNPFRIGVHGDILAIMIEDEIWLK